MDPVEKLRKLGGDPRFFGRILRHPALKVLERLDELDRRRAELAARVAKLNQTLTQADEQLAGITRELGDDGPLEREATAWRDHLREAIRHAGHVRLGLSAEHYLMGETDRRGMFATHHDRYFQVAFLAPYTAFLNKAQGREASPDWKLIEAWLRKPLRLPEEKSLRVSTWWGKEVIQRRSRPSRPLLYALAAGAAVYLEARAGGRRARWVVERDHVGRPMAVEDNPFPLKRILNAQDRAYLDCVFQFVPAARADFAKLYPGVEPLKSGLPPDPIAAHVKKKLGEADKKLPPRFRLKIAGLRGDDPHAKAIMREERKRLQQLSAQTEPRWLRRLVTRRMRKGSSQ